MNEEISHSNYWLNNLHSPKPDRIKHLVGNWMGYAHPHDPALKREIFVKYRFKRKLNSPIIIGQIEFASTRNKNIKIYNNLCGGFHNDNHLQFVYRSKKTGVQGSWGSIHITLSPDGKTLTGQVHGNSSHDLKYFSSSLKLQKAPYINLKSLRLPPEKQRTPHVFVSHGGESTEWRQLVGYLKGSKCIVESFESDPRTGKDIFKEIMSMTSQNPIGVFILSREDELIKGGWRARQNVVHELGLFQGAQPGRPAIILWEKGVEKFTNVSGIAHLEYESGKMKKKFKEIKNTILQNK